MDREDRALAELAVDVERAAVMGDDVLDDGKAEAGAAELAGAGRVDPVEPLGEPGQVLARDAVAMVAHGDGERRRPLARARAWQEARRRAGGDLDRRAGPAVFDGVVEKVLEHLGKLVRV